METKEKFTRYKESVSLEERKKKYKKMVDSYPEAVAVIIEPHPKAAAKHWNIIKDNPSFK